MVSSTIWNSRHTLAVGLALAGLLSLGGCAEIYTRDDFTTKVDGKSMEDVRAIVGKPLKVDEDEVGVVMWTYERRTIDIENKNKRDKRTVLVFTNTVSDDGARVSEVRFE